LIKNSQPFGKKMSGNRRGGDSFDSRCMVKKGISTDCSCQLVHTIASSQLQISTLVGLDSV